MKDWIMGKLTEEMKDWDVKSMTVERHRDAALAKKKLIEFYSCEGESNYYKKYYYMEKLASYGHIPAIKTLKIMRRDGVGCDRTLEKKQEGEGENNKRVIQIDIENVEGELIFTHSSEYNTVKRTLENAVINEIDLKGAVIIGYDLRGADLRGGKLRNTDLRYAEFTGANFTCTDLRGANLRHVCFMGVDFSCTDLRGANLIGAKYTKKQIDSAITDETTIFYGCKND